MKPLLLTDQQFKTVLNEREFPIAVEFWSFRCEACRKMAPVVSQIAEMLDGKLKIYKVNVDDNPRIVAAFRIPLIPYLLVLKDGRVIASFAEHWSVQDVQAAVERSVS